MPPTKHIAIDLSAFPPASVTEYSTILCLACIFDIFTKQIGLAPRTAYSEIKRYAPTVAELTAPQAIRPFFDSEEKHPHCPHCNSAKRWQARLDTYRFVSGKQSDAARRALWKSLPKRDEQFQMVEAKSDKRTLFFDWLDSLGRELDPDPNIWLPAVTRAFLERSEPKTDWAEPFANLRAVKRSSRLEKGWERDGARLFLAPQLYHEALVVQYLVSRSHAHGGMTLEGRLTLVELLRRLRYSGYLKSVGIEEIEQSELLERVVEKLAGGTTKVKVYYLVDRRDFLAKVKSVYARYAN